MKVGTGKTDVTDAVGAPAPLSLPRWSDQLPTPDPRALAYLVIGLGEDGPALAAQWAGRLNMPCTMLTGDRFSDVDAAVSAALDRLLVGHRVCAIGPEADLLLIASRLDAAGLIEAEYAMCATSTSDLTVYCVHCSATTRTAARTGDIVICSGCRRHLYIDAHVSRLRGGYLGTDAYAQELR
ncbi:hypothetical protein GCM10027169_33560 [Gordonia jinhuaensis]|uniref:Dimethylamine monooxygenase subunit DmmA-like C-terminal domain-containing protein n=1 Tax=Gordonia jinhuaensis TaxID=1517702 RepID=A0A916T1B5_9ACTN|nr:dimethylamine monooxygenase subunit DmmA family protein [Gordonia jinhuaensis]GGB27618.1 hypothetical protein GCM10011489_14760 [Gordonia jinhuaensis]